MLNNNLKLNDSKSEFLVIGTPQQISKISIDDVRVGSSNVIPSVTARNLGVYFDTNLNMETHVKNICKSTYYLLYNLRRIRKYFDQESMKLVVHALITSKLDYCNGLLFGMPDSLIAKLQRVQNACARLVYRRSKFTSTAPLLRELHWLPVRQRISFKILLIVYKSLSGQAPNYITELLQLKVQSHSHSLRSSTDKLLFQIPHGKTKITLGDRAFAIAAPKLWNSLPIEIRSTPSLNVFKSNLKTYLFN